MRTALAVLALTVAGAGSAAEPSTIPVPLNHLYIVVDTETYEAIGSDSFLKEQFAPYETRMTTRADRTYIGEYFYGTNTYFEFFDAGNPGNGPRGKSGIAFGVDRAGDLTSLEKQLHKQFNVDKGPITRGLDGEQVPWFTMLSVVEPMQLSAWLMEYDAEFLQQWKPQAGGARDGIRRRDILSRYVASLGLAERPYLIRDITGIVAAVDPQTRRSLVRFCGALGHEIASAGDRTIIRGPDFTLTLIDETDALHGIRQIEFQINRSRAATRRIGSSTLQIRSNGTAVWSFDPFSADGPSLQASHFLTICCAVMD
jgi:hypothetical protein